MERLKPCPFCGGEAKYESVNYTGYDIEDGVVECTECFAEIAVNCKQSAIAAWNTRAEDADNARLRSENKALKADYDSMRHQRDGWVDEYNRVLAELAAMTRERDAAVEDIRMLLIDSGDCKYCAHWPGDAEECRDTNCKPKWRGAEKEAPNEAAEAQWNRRTEVTELTNLLGELVATAAELEESRRRERAAISDMKDIAFSDNPCAYCAKRRGWDTCRDCDFDWRGPQEAGEEDE